ncbi:MAG: EAL domain-containing protein [Bacillota bacterium]
MLVPFYSMNVSVYPAYQPIYSLTDMQIIGYEALIRSQEGLSPGELFFKAKNEGKMVDFDIECLSNSISNIAKISGIIFLNIRPTTLMWLLQNYESWFKQNIPKDKVVLEITEVEEILDMEYFLRVLKKLRKSGYKYSIDDIATGYNRLHLVIHSAPDYIKLDDPIIRDCHKSTIKRSVIKHFVEISKDIGSILIAENIETRRELQTIQDLKVQYAQGFYLGKPTTDIE